MVQIVWHSNLFDISGYSKATRECVLALHNYGIDVKISPIYFPVPPIVLAPDLHELYQHLIAKPERKGQKVYIYHQLPENWRRRLHPSIGFTYWETSKIHDYWVNKANQMNAVFLSSLHNIEAFRNSGVRAPLFHIRPSLSNVSPSSGQPPEYLRQLPPFRFLSVSQWVGRKGFDILLRAFWEEFSSNDNVALVIKTFDLDTQAFERIKSECAVSAQSAPVYIDSQSRNDNEMDALYRNCQAFVLPSRGEGLSYPLLEASARGLPVITTGWGGQLDFLPEHSSFLVPYQLVPVNPQPYYGYQSDQLWAEPSVQSLRNIMRFVFENYEQARMKGAAAKQYVEDHFIPWKTANDFVSALRAIGIPV